MDGKNLLTVIHLARKVFCPQFEAEAEKLVFSVICYFYGKGFRMVAFGDGCDNSDVTDEVDQISGWNSNKTIYQFKLLDSSGKVLQVKCLMMGEDKLLVSWVQAVGGGSLVSVELSVSKFAGDEKEVLKNADQFIKTLSQNEKQAEQQQGSATPQYNLMENQHRGTAPQFAGMRSTSNPINPLMVGRDDLNPFGGIEKDFGSQVGPTHPVFRRKFGENESLRDGPDMLPPGARFNFIGPPGMQGSHPGDYAIGGQARRRRDMDDIGPPTGQFPDHMFM